MDIQHTYSKLSKSHLLAIMLEDRCEVRGPRRVVQYAGYIRRLANAELRNRDLVMGGYISRHGIERCALSVEPLSLSLSDKSSGSQVGVEDEQSSST